MYQMVQDIVKDYQPVWESTPKFVSAFGVYTAKLEALKIQAEKQRSYVLGVRQSRDDFRATTAKLGVRIASALFAFAEDERNLELLAMMNISESQLMHRSHSDTVILLDRILIHATLHANELLEYGISAEKLAELITRRDELVVNILAPRKAIIKRKDSSVQIDKLSGEIDQLLKNSLDKLVNVLRPENEGFYNEYFNSRMVMSYGNNHGPTSSDPTIGPVEPIDGLFD